MTPLRHLSICTGLALASTIWAAGGTDDAFIYFLPDDSILIGPSEDFKPTEDFIFGSVCATNSSQLFVNTIQEGNDGWVWAFDTSGGVIYQGRFTDEDTDSGFGRSMVANDGLLVVGAPLAGGQGNLHLVNLQGFGMVYKIEAPEGMNLSEFGASVDMIGSLLAVGAPGTGSGTVLLYDVESTKATLIGSVSAFPEGDAARFGTALDLREREDNGAIELLVTAPGAPTSGNGLGAAVLYQVSSNGFDQLISYLAHPDADAPVAFAASALICDDLNLAIGSPGLEDTISGEVLLFVKDSDDVTYQRHLDHSASDWADGFGCALAIDADGTLAVGVKGASDRGWNSGACAIYTYAGASLGWVESDRIHGYATGTGSQFGSSMAFMNIGTPHRHLLSIGAPGYDRAYMFSSNGVGNPWTSDVRASAPIRLQSGQLADGVNDIDEMIYRSIDADGSRVVVGEWNEANNGRVQVLTMDADGSYMLEHVFASPPSTAAFGASVSISGDTVAIGGASSEPTVWLAARSEAGWSELMPLDVPVSSEFPFVGWDIALGTGNEGSQLLAVSAWTNEEGEGALEIPLMPEVHLFWVEGNKGYFQQTLAQPGGPVDWSYAYSVDTNADRVVVGCPRWRQNPEDDPSGSVFVYSWDDQVDAFALEVQLYNDDIDTATWSAFGFDVAIDGDRLLVGAPYADDNDTAELTLASAGEAWVFDNDPKGTWTDGQKLLPLDRQAEDAFGYAVALLGDEALIGAPFSDYADPNAGLAWRFNVRPDSGASSWACSEALMRSESVGGEEVGTAVALLNVDTKRGTVHHCLATAPWMWLEEGGVGTTLLFQASAVANWIGDEGIIWDPFDTTNWSLAPAYADTLRFAQWLHEGTELAFHESLELTLSVEVFLTEIWFASADDATVRMEGSITVGSPPHLGASALGLETDGPILLEGPVIIGGDDLIGTLYLASGVNMTTMDTLTMGEGSCLRMTAPPDGGQAGIRCTGAAPSLGGTLEVEHPLATQLGARHVILQAPSAPASDEDRWDMVVFEQLEDPTLTLHLLYETVETLQGSVWQAVAEVVQITDLLGFGAPGSVTVDGQPVDVELVDLTGDGADEICVVFQGSPGTLLIFENDGGGGIAQQLAINVATDPVGLCTGDIDGDGAADLIIAGGLSQTVEVYFNDGDADLADGFTFYQYPLTKVPTAIATVDADSDTLADLLVGLADHDNDGMGSLLFLHGAASVFGGGLGGGGESDVPGFPIVIDPSEEEGQKDFIAFFALSGGHAGAAKNSLVLGNVAPVVTISTYLVGTGLTGLSNADLDGDGDLDMALTSSATDDLILLRQTSSGGFGSPLYVSLGTDPAHIEAVDFDADGNVDLAAITAVASGDRVVRILQNNGNLAFTSVDSALGDNPVIFSVGDVTGDNVPDLVTVGGASALQGAGPLQALSMREQTDTAPPCPGDVDANGVVDIEDLLTVISQFGGDCTSGCTADCNGDGEVTIDDLLVVIGAFGACPSSL